MRMLFNCYFMQVCALVFAYNQSLSYLILGLLAIIVALMSLEVLP